MFVAEIANGSHIRKGAVMVCSKCIIDVRKPKDSKTYDVPDFLSGLFGNKK